MLKTWLKHKKDLTGLSIMIYSLALSFKKSYFLMVILFETVNLP